MTQKKIKALFGKPDRSQNIGGQDYWYYDLKDNMYQLVFSGEVVSEVNKY